MRYNYRPFLQKKPKKPNLLTFKEYELRKGGGCGGVLGVKGTQKSRYRDEKFVIFRSKSGVRGS